jgi:capsule biosynthesis phosphatase
MRICFDLDGTLCTIRKEAECYSEVKVREEIKRFLLQRKAEGHYIIIYTARGMNTFDGNVGKINAKLVPLTLKWLENNKIPYDEIYFGKPSADWYIDDKAINVDNLNL